MKIINEYILEKLKITSNSKINEYHLPSQLYNFETFIKELNKIQKSYKNWHGDLIVNRYLNSYYNDKDKFYFFKINDLFEYNKKLANKILKYNSSSKDLYEIRNYIDLRNNGFEEEIDDEDDERDVSFLCLKDKDNNLIFYYIDGEYTDKYFIIEKETFIKLLKKYNE